MSEPRKPRAGEQPRPRRRMAPRKPPFRGSVCAAFDDFDDENDETDTQPTNQTNSYSFTAPCAFLPEDEYGANHQRTGAGKSSVAADEFVGSGFQPNPDHPLDGIFAPQWAILVATTKAELLVLSQLAYWFGISRAKKLRCKIQRDNYWWVSKTYRQLGRETRLRKDQVRGAVRSLRARDLLVVADDENRGRLLRYRLNATAITAIVEEAESRCATTAEDDDDF